MKTKPANCQNEIYQSGLSKSDDPLGNGEFGRNSDYYWTRALELTWQVLGVALLALWGILKVQSEIPYGKFQHSQFERAYMINYIYKNYQAKFTEARLILKTK